MYEGHKGKCCCFHHFVTPILVLAIAVVFLLKNLNILDMYIADIIWPSLLGASALLAAIQRCCKCCAGCDCNCYRDKEHHKIG